MKVSVAIVFGGVAAWLAHGLVESGQVTWAGVSLVLVFAVGAGAIADVPGLTPLARLVVDALPWTDDGGGG